MYNPFTRFKTFDNMRRQQRRSIRALGAAALAGAAFFVAALAPAPASATAALTVTISKLFVENVNHNVNCNPANPTTPIPAICALGSSALNNNPTNGNISNDPEIQFAENAAQRCSLSNVTDSSVFTTKNPNPTNLSNPSGSNGMNVCNSSVYLCAQVEISGPDSTGLIDIN